MTRGAPAGEEGVNLVTLEFVSPTEAEINRPASVLARRVVPLLLLGVMAAIGVAAAVPIDRVVSSAGQLVSTRPNILVQPLETSIVRSFEVRVNQTVRAGEVIARLDPTFAGADASALTTQEAALRAEVGRLEAEAADRPFPPGQDTHSALQAAIFAQRQAERQFRTEAFAQRIRSLQESIQRSQAELAQLTQRAQIAGQIETMRRDLERVQVGSRLNSLVATDNRLEVQRGIANAEGTIRGAQRDLAAAAADLDAYLGNWRAQVVQELALKRRDLSDVRESLSKAQLRRDLIEMRAPVDAVVLDIGKSSLGAVLAPGEMLVTLVPLDARLEVEASIEPRDLGFVGVGDRVTIKLESFPFVRHGTVEGRVLSVSQNTTQGLPADGATGAAAGGQPRFYRARISMEEFRLRDLPPDSRLLPGMPVQADIIVGERTPLRYFFERVMPHLVQGLREP